MEAQGLEGDWSSLYPCLTMKERACDDCRMVVECELHLVWQNRITLPWASCTIRKKSDLKNLRIFQKRILLTSHSEQMRVLRIWSLSFPWVVRLDPVPVVCEEI